MLLKYPFGIFGETVALLSQASQIIGVISEVKSKCDPYVLSINQLSAMKVSVKLSAPRVKKIRKKLKILMAQTKRPMTFIPWVDK